MSAWQLILRSLRYHWRIHVAVALGVAVATAVLTGALVVGDSMRGSLEHLALDRLGPIDDVLITDRFFRAELAHEIADTPQFTQSFFGACPLIVLEGSVKNGDSEHPASAGQVTIFGADDFAPLGGEFGPFGDGPPPTIVPPGEIVLNEPLANEIRAGVGDEVLVRVGKVDQIPPDSALGRKTDTTRSRRLKVSRIIPAEGFGRFGLRPTQLLPQNAYAARETLVDMLDVGDRANAIFVTGRLSAPRDAMPDRAAENALNEGLHPQLTDFGYSLQECDLGYWQLACERLVIEPAAERAALRELAADHPQPVLTYLANTIRVGEKEIPYSTVAAIDFVAAPPLGPFTSPTGESLPPLADGEIALNTWAADDLGAKIGDEVELVYFEPESTHGLVREDTVKLRLVAIVALEGAGADRNLTPEMKGVTDQTSISNWDPPFPFDAGRVRKKDEKYWDDYRATPKAFVSLATGRRLWTSRFGQTTSIRLAQPESTTAVQLAAALKLKPADFGFRFLPVKRQALLAAAGTTPFGVLFLAFSFFLIAAAVMLVAILFQLGIEQRAAELGVLLAVGLGSRRAVRLFSAEGLLVAALGAAVGVAAGVGYAALMLAGLCTWWLGAISTPFLHLYARPSSLLVGYLIGLAVTAATIYWTARRMRRVAVRRLLAGEASSTPLLARQSYRRTRIVGWMMCAAAIVLGLGAMRLRGEAQAGAFFTSGLLVLSALLVLMFVRLRSMASGGSEGHVARTIGGLSLRSGARNPRRSTLSVGLVAAACFLIVATSAFRLDPESESQGRTSGSGGYTLLCESDQPIYQNLNSDKGRDELSFSDKSDKLLAAAHLIALRVHAGDDASCLNLYQPTEPRVLGVPAAMIERGGFAWAATAATTPEERANPWRLLNRELPADDQGVHPVPVVLDLNTAMYSLHLMKGVGETYEITDQRGGKVRLQVVGLLANSLFQGSLLIGEKPFLEMFPGVSGYRFFLVDAPPRDAVAVQDALEETLENYGFDARPAADVLAGYMAVQNTCLSTFQSLGGLGLLLGTVGLAIVQLRSVLERRSELALMQAVGFRRQRLALMVMIENALLLLSGLAVGLAAALVAVLPHLFGGGASLPWGMVLATLGLVLVVGLLAGLLAVRAVIRAELLPSLRAE